MYPKKCKCAEKKRHFEVERKYAISADERKSLPDKLSGLGFKHEGQVYMTDTFVPADKEGDMIRVRQETHNDRSSFVLTLKSWEEVAGNRERAEQEEPISEFVARCLIDVGQRLSDAALLSYSKERELYTRVLDDGRKVTVALDTVEGLKQYSGFYTEIEIVVSCGKEVPAAREYIQQFVVTLLGDERAFVTLSYQDMLKRSRAS